MISLDHEEIKLLWELYKAQGEDVITWNHYELAERTTEKNPEAWKSFLMDPDVASWIQAELKLIQDSELKKMVKGAAKTRSVGQAQLINAFSKMNDTQAVKEGPVFIYMHVPLNAEQKHAPNALSLEDNPFQKE